MTLRPRLPNTVIWALEDAIALTLDFWTDLQTLSSHAEAHQDAVTLAAVARCMDRLTRIERHLRTARATR